ncbi:MAG: hypothetical protein AB7L65_10340 [Hyphomonadaceae bacterium]
MKTRLAAAFALAFALGQVAAMPAYAGTATASPFRTAAPQTFSSQDLQRYGLSPAASDRAAALQTQGYAVKVLTPQEAQRYQAGVTNTQWLLLGILAGVVIIAVAVD